MRSYECAAKASWSPKCGSVEYSLYTPCHANRLTRICLNGREMCLSSSDALLTQQSCFVGTMSLQEDQPRATTLAHISPPANKCGTEEIATSRYIPYPYLQAVELPVVLSRHLSCHGNRHARVLGQVHALFEKSPTVFQEECVTQRIAYEFETQTRDHGRGDVRMQSAVLYHSQYLACALRFGPRPLGTISINEKRYLGPLQLLRVFYTTFRAPLGH